MDGLEVLDVDRIPRDAGVAPLATENGIWVEAKPADHVGPVLCDHDRIQQVLGNLIGNA